MLVTLNEGYLRAVNRGSKNLYRFFKSKFNISAFNEKMIFSVCLLYCFFRLQIYEAIAAMFWQSSSYVYLVGHDNWGEKNLKQTILIAEHGHASEAPTGLEVNLSQPNY